MKTLRLCISIVLLSLLLNFSALAQHHHGDWSFGVVDGCAAVIEPEPDEVEPVVLEQFITAGLYNGDWGIEFWNLPNPDLKSVRVLFTSSPAGLLLFHEADLILGDDGSSTGPGFFDMSWPDPGIHHAHIDAYTYAVGTYTVTFKLVNGIANDGENTALCDSPEYSLDFVAVPEPSGLLALAVPAAVLAFRRRS